MVHGYQFLENDYTVEITCGANDGQNGDQNLTVAYCDETIEGNLTLEARSQIYAFEESSDNHTYDLKIYNYADILFSHFILDCHTSDGKLVVSMRCPMANGIRSYCGVNFTVPAGEKMYAIVDAIWKDDAIYQEKPFTLEIGCDEGGALSARTTVFSAIMSSVLIAWATIGV